MRSSIRVLVVDDSALIRQILTRALSLDPRVVVVGTAKTGLEAVEKARDLSPDVITLDIEMPELTGLEALPHIRRYSNARVVMLSSIDDSDTTYRALALGAVDFIPKPSAGMASSITELSETLLKKIKIAYRIDPRRVGSLTDDATAERGSAGGIAPDTSSVSNRLTSCVTLAASTGGPPALERVFSGLSASMPAAYVVVQHLPMGFSASLARRLNAAGNIEVVEAAHGMEVEPGMGYLAPYGHHAKLARAADGSVRIFLTDDPPLNGVRPAADVLLESNAEVFGHGSVGVVLTGMGVDGARGAAAINRAGGDTIIQDEASSVVWGMPGAVVKLNAAGRTVALGLVAAEIRRSIRARTEGVSAQHG
jgi:two-component system chemotaxis response regulator CheB